MWDVRRSVRLEEFPPRPVVVHFRFLVRSHSLQILDWSVPPVARKLRGMSNRHHVTRRSSR
jgi:hypothetical protein